MKVKHIVAIERSLLKKIDECKIPGISHDYWWGDPHMINPFDNEYKVYFQWKLPCPYPFSPIGTYVPQYAPPILQLSWDRRNIYHRRLLPVRVRVEWLENSTNNPDIDKAINDLSEYFGDTYKVR